MQKSQKPGRFPSLYRVCVLGSCGQGLFPDNSRSDRQTVTLLVDDTNPTYHYRVTARDMGNIIPLLTVNIITLLKSLH